MNDAIGPIITAAITLAISEAIRTLNAAYLERQKQRAARSQQQNEAKQKEQGGERDDLANYRRELQTRINELEDDNEAYQKERNDALSAANRWQTLAEWRAEEIARWKDRATYAELELERNGLLKPRPRTGDTKPGGNS